MGLYGWYGNFDLRDNRGELTTTSEIQPVRYVTYDEALFRDAAQSTRLEFLSFGVTLQEKDPVQPTTVDPVSPTELPIELIVGVGAAAVVVILVALLVIALICVFGRRKNQPRKKK